MKKDFNIMNYFNTRALFMGIGLSRILSNSHEHILLTIILGTLIGLLFLYVFRIEMRSCCLNILANCLVIMIALIILVNMISTMYLTKMPKFLIGLPFIILVMYLLSKKEVVLYRVGTVLLFINLSLYTIALFSLFKYFDLTNFSYTNNSVSNVLISALEFALFSTTPTFFTRTEKTKDIPIYKMYIASACTMGIMCILTYGILGYSLSSLVRYPEYFILKEVSISYAIKNIENIISFMWIIDAFMIIASCSNSIKENLNKKYFLNIILFVTLLATTYVNNHYEYLLYLYHYAPHILLGMILFLWIRNKKLIFQKR